jgi:hypothetical protein
MLANIRADTDVPVLSEKSHHGNARRFRCALVGLVTQMGVNPNSFLFHSAFLSYICKQKERQKSC